MKKTILYLHRYPLEYESVIYPCTRRLMDLLTKKYKVIYLSFKIEGKRDEKLRKNINFIELPYTINRKEAGDKWLKSLLWYYYLPRIKRVVEKIRPSLIVCKEQLPFLSSLLSRLNVPIIQDIGDWWWTTFLCKYNLEKISEAIEDLEIRDWNKHKNVFLITHSKAESEMISSRGMDLKRITFVNHPSSEDTFKAVDASNLRKKIGIKKDDWVVAVHGITHPSKDYGRLLKWWAKISLEHKNWILLNIGGTIGERWYRNRVRKLKIEKNAFITGWIKEAEELNEYLNTADCLLVTRKNNLANKGLIPSSLFHSLSMGKPLVITGLDGLSEMVRNKIDGFSYEPDNYDSFKSTLEYIYNHPKEAKAIAKAGIKRGKECFDLEKSAKGFFRVIEKNMA